MMKSVKLLDKKINKLMFFPDQILDCMVDSDVFYFPRLLPNGGLVAEGGGRLVWTEGEDQLMAQVVAPRSPPAP